MKTLRITTALLLTLLAAATCCAAPPDAALVGSYSGSIKQTTYFDGIKQSAKLPMKVDIASDGHTTFTLNGVAWNTYDIIFTGPEGIAKIVEPGQPAGTANFQFATLHFKSTSLTGAIAASYNVFPPDLAFIKTVDSKFALKKLP